MPSFGSTSRIVFASLFILVVLMRMSGAHLHYCFDGTEPPISFHLDSDGGVHHPLGVDSQVRHSDLDISLSDDVLVKKSTQDYELLALILALTFFATYFVRQLRLTPNLDAAPLLVQRRIHGLPPLRGPPL